jgi:hypothetical protein
MQFAAVCVRAWPVQLPVNCLSGQQPLQTVDRSWSVSNKGVYMSYVNMSATTTVALLPTDASCSRLCACLACATASTSAGSSVHCGGGTCVSAESCCVCMFVCTSPPIIITRHLSSLLLLLLLLLLLPRLRCCPPTGYSAVSTPRCNCHMGPLP